VRAEGNISLANLTFANSSGTQFTWASAVANGSDGKEKNITDSGSSGWIDTTLEYYEDSQFKDIGLLGDENFIFS